MRTTFQRLLLVSLAYVLFSGCFLLSGCAVAKTTVYPIQGTDIVNMPKGTAYTAAQDGYFLSKFYVGEVMNAQVVEKKKVS
jgi:hypothetical protein